MTSGPARGLGRGLGSLIPNRAPVAPGIEQQPGDQSDAQSPPANASPPPAQVHGREGRTASGETEPGAVYASIEVERIRPNPQQPRSEFDQETLAELAASIGQVGLLQPIVVRPLDADDYELVMGERRWRAAQLAGLDTIPAIVRTTDDDAMLRDALLENLHRAELNALEEAAAYQQLLSDFGCTHEELASRLGKSRPHISNTIRLLRLSPPVQRRVAAGVLSAGHARALLAIEDPELQDRLATTTVAQGLSVRGLEELVTLGLDAEAPAPRVRAGRSSSPELDEIAFRLGDRLETRCRVELGRKRGRIVIDFASVDDLRRIVSVVDPSPTD